MDGVIKVTEYAQVPDVVALLGLTVVDANAVVALEEVMSAREVPEEFEKMVIEGK